MPKPEFVYVTYIETTPEQLWDALTSTTFTRQYWFDTELQSDWKVGSPLALVMSGKTTDTGERVEGPVHHGHAHAFPARRHPHHGLR